MLEIGHQVVIGRREREDDDRESERHNAQDSLQRGGEARAGGRDRADADDDVVSTGVQERVHEDDREDQRRRQEERGQAPSQDSCCTRARDRNGDDEEGSRPTAHHERHDRLGQGGDQLGRGVERSVSPGDRSADVFGDDAARIRCPCAQPCLRVRRGSGVSVMRSQRRSARPAGSAPRCAARGSTARYRRRSW